MTAEQGPHGIDAALLHESADDLYDHAPCGYLSTTPAGVIVRVNQTFLQWTGYPRDELVGHVRFADLLRAGGKLFYETHVAPLLQMHGTAQELALDLVAKDERLLPTLVSMTQTRDASGRPLLVRLTVFNATDRRRYEQELLRAKSAAEQATSDLHKMQAAVIAERDRLRQILDVLPVAVLIVETEGHTVLTNAAARALLGQDLTADPFLFGAPAVGNAAELLRADGTRYAPTELPLQQALRGEAISAREALVRHAERGHTVPVLLSSAPLRTGDGGVTGAVAVVQDITPLKEMERMREDFLAAAAHDLKNPVTSAQGLAQLARRRLTRLAPPEAEPISRHLEQIEVALRRLTSLIDGLVDSTRVGLGALLDLDRRPMDLVGLARTVVRQHTSGAGDRVVLNTEVDELVVTGDADRIERVLANLVGNAVKYSAAGRPVRVHVTREDGEDTTWAVLQVRDTGLGIPAEDLGHIFERYYRASNVRGRIQGTGIGLASVRHIVEQHGGAIAVESTEGVGSTFTVRLPLVPS